MSPVAESNLAKFLVEAVSIRNKRLFLPSFFGCLARTLWFIHRHKLRHRDIKPENILIDQGRAYFTDFDCSYSWMHTNRSTTVAAPPRTWKYASPEVARSGFQAGTRINSSSDIWSLGCVFLEIITVIKGRSVSELDSYLNNNHYYANPQGVQQWINKLEKLESETSPTDAVLEWIRGMLKEDPDERPSAHELVERTLAMPNSSEFCCVECKGDDFQSILGQVTTSIISAVDDLSDFVEISTDRIETWQPIDTSVTTATAGSVAPSTVPVSTQEPSRKTFNWNSYLAEVEVKLGKKPNSLSRDQLMVVMATYDVYQKSMLAAGYVEEE
ncbi:PAK-2p27 [Dactylella cylindrospora]|nr:PAK-2p27 [Dactylella cylindrospora]